MGVASGAGTGAATGSVLGVPGAVAGAIVGGVTSLIGGNKQAKASDKAGQLQAQLAREALAEQRRIYDIEAAKEKEQTAYDRSEKRREEGMVRSSRQNAFGGFGNNLTTFSKGYAPVLGMSAEDTAGLLEGRNAGARATSAAVPRSPMPPDQGEQLPPNFGTMPRMDPNMPAGPRLPGPSGSMGSTVWLQAPTGEQMEVPIMDAQPMIEAGAILIPGPRG